MFYHSLVSDWNHGNAHFLRGVASELIARGHDVRIFEPKDGWSLQNLIASHGREPLLKFQKAYPRLKSTKYTLDRLDLDQALDRADLALAHEWNDPELIKQLGKHRARARSYRLLFHDTHHRAVTAPKAMAGFDLCHFDGVLSFGRIMGEMYRVTVLSAHVCTCY